MHDVAGAEDALSDAFAAALVDWPTRGVPEHPEAWIVTVARRKGIDAARRRRTRAEAAAHLRLLTEENEAAAVDRTPLPDDRLGLMFACVHPAISPGVRAPLILQTIFGLDAATIASAFSVTPGTMRQRLVRAKSRIRLAGIPFRMPERAELAGRLGAVLEAIFIAFEHGGSERAGTARVRDLADEAIWLGRLVATLLPDEPEALGLLALMLYAHARRATRRDPRGEHVPVADRDPAAWDAALVEKADALLSRARSLNGAGRYQLEAAAQSAQLVGRLTARSG
jgi:RNA polymerase sigma-70 factor (ECF subfamily)